MHLQLSGSAILANQYYVKNCDKRFEQYLATQHSILLDKKLKPESMSLL